MSQTATVNVSSTVALCNALILSVIAVISSQLYCIPTCAFQVDG